jgi:hypothetical protein
VPRRQFQHAYHRESEQDDGPGLVTCAVYLFVFVLIGAILGYLILKLTGSL